MAYSTIPNSDIDPESPVNTSLMTRLRDNPEGIAAADSGAPRNVRKSIAIGGSDADGSLSNATTLTGIGFHEYDSFTRTTSLSVPAVSIIRVTGSLTLSSTVTVDNVSAAIQRAAQLFGAVSGSGGTDGSAGNGGGGGGSIGAGGVGNGASAAGGAGISATFSRLFAGRIPLLGGIGGDGDGAGGDGSGGGGSLILLVRGNCVFTGGTITANGAAGDSNGDGAGGGGSIIVVCAGTVTDGTFNAAGGAGGSGSGSLDGGGGGGGLVQLVATAFAGSQTFNVAGGSSAHGGGGNGAAGSSGSFTLTEPQINALMAW